MAQFRKILISGSNAHVSQVTASNIPAVTDNDTVLFADNSTGIVRTLSSLTYDSSGTELQFSGGTFSGSFSGNGSGLTNVTANLEQSLIDGAGVVNFSYDGSTGTTASLDLSPAGGLTFYNGNTDAGTSTGTGTDGFKLGLTSSLAGDGLEFPTANDYSVLQIDLDSNSGLTLSATGIKIDPSIGGDGLTNTNGVLGVDLATNGGLVFDGSGEIKLSNDLPGTGLSYSTNNSVMEVDTSVVVTDTNTITIKTGSNNITIDVDSDSAVNVLDVTGGKSARLIDNPRVEFNISDTLDGNFTFNDDLTVKGDFTVEGNSNSVNLETQNLNIADQFILVNSGSTTQDGGFIVNTDDTNGAFFFFDDATNRWGVSTEIAKTTTNFIAGTTANTAMIAVVERTTGNESSFINGNPIFGSATDNAVSRLGCIKITTAASTNESSAYIYA